jgi:hypothetical protein
VHAELPATFVDGGHLTVDAQAGAWSALGGEEGRLDGSFAVAVDSAIDHHRHSSPALKATLQLAASLTPRLDAAGGGALYVNSPIALTGDGFLLGGAEGETRAVLDGCFLPVGAAAPCAANGVQVSGVEIAAAPDAPWDRQHASFPFAPAVAGIHPGTFQGKVTLRNLPSGGAQTSSQPSTLSVQIQRPTLSMFSPSAASLGQFVDISGGGFVGGVGGSVTLVHLVGKFSADGAPGPAPVDLELVPGFVDGQHLRYVLDEADELGHLVNLRTITGSFVGTAQPIVIDGSQQEVGDPTQVQLAIAPVKQVVYVSFDRSYAASLRGYGLFAADAAIRARVMTVAARDYAAVNIDFRESAPDDFALYAQVDLVGPDPNGLGLFGYDNTPGKDVGNSRLFDRIGGVNATTQADGFPGFGGVFVDNFLGFSAHPPSTVMQIDPEPDFDAIFDPLRPDTGGQAATPGEVQLAPVLTDGVACPASDRILQVACGIYALGNLIGTTMTHETGHSLGLANPYGDGFHDTGDLPNRLMEAGSDRPFDERAELNGMGPGEFCVDEFTYLQSILPTRQPDPAPSRPSCDQL